MIQPRRMAAIFAIAVAGVMCVSPGHAATAYPVSDITLILPTGPSPGIDRSSGSSPGRASQRSASGSSS